MVTAREEIKQASEEISAMEHSVKLSAWINFVRYWRVVILRLDPNPDTDHSDLNVRTSEDSYERTDGVIKEFLSILTDEKDRGFNEVQKFKHAVSLCYKSINRKQRKEIIEVLSAVGLRLGIPNPMERLDVIPVVPKVDMNLDALWLLIKCIPDNNS